jgi:hypothetical protein
MHDPIGQKHQSIPQLNLYINEHIALFDNILDELPKKMLLLFHQFPKQFHINIKQMNTNTPKHSKSKGINFH